MRAVEAILAVRDQTGIPALLLGAPRVWLEGLINSGHGGADGKRDEASDSDGRDQP